MWKTSIVAQLTLLVAGTLVVLLGVFLALGYSAGRRVLRAQIDDRLGAVAESKRAFVAEWIGRQQDRVTIFATRGVLRNYLEKHVAGHRRLKFPRFCGLDCGEHNDSHEQQQQNRSPL